MRRGSRPQADTTAIDAAAQKDAEDEAAALLAEFESSTDEARQIEIVYQLAMNRAPPARASLDRIYHRTPNPQLKIEIVQSLSFIESEDFEPSLTLLAEAIAPEQPAELRQAAIGTLRDLNHPKTLRVWRTVLADADPEIREAAQQAVEYYAIFDNGK